MRFELYCPVQISDGALEYVVQRVSALCGGCTITKGTGVWAGPQGTTVREDVNIITAYGDFNVLGNIKATMLEFGRIADQEAVLVGYSNASYDLQYTTTEV